MGLLYKEFRPPVCSPQDCSGWSLLQFEGLQRTNQRRLDPQIPTNGLMKWAHRAAPKVNQETQCHSCHSHRQSVGCCSRNSGTLATRASWKRWNSPQTLCSSCPAGSTQLQKLLATVNSVASVAEFYKDMKFLNFFPHKSINSHIVLKCTAGFTNFFEGTSKLIHLAVETHSGWIFFTHSKTLQATWRLLRNMVRMLMMMYRYTYR